MKTVTTLVFPAARLISAVTVWIIFLHLTFHMSTLLYAWFIKINKQRNNNQG